MTIITAIIIFSIGASIGSFISVVVHRLNKKKSIFISRSVCPKCKKQLKWKHLLPVFSWIFLRGRCAYCQEKISYHYFALEVITGAVFTLAFLKFPFVEELPNFVYFIDWANFQFFLFYALIFSFLMAIFFYDLQFKIIPDRFSLPAIGAAIAGGLVLGTPLPLDMLIGGLAIGGFFMLQFLLSKGTWIGGGDLRIGLLMGILLGWKLGIVALVLSYLIGGLISIGLIIKKSVGRKSAVPFAPFLVAGTIITMLYGAEILNSYTELFLII